nr:UDP-N-acetylglucosamine 2-epimerase [Mesorhizobium loti]
MRKILIATAGRSDFGINRQIMDQIVRTPGMDYSLLVTGAHLSTAGGLTVREIEAERRPIGARIALPDSYGSGAATAAAMGVALTGTAEYLAREHIDMMLIVGDRFEMIAIAAATVPFNIPLVHVHGGEVSFGAIDDAFRHAITKMAHLHFAATEDYALRIVRMGEEPWRVTVSGAPGLDNVRLAQLPDRVTLARQFNLDLSEPPIVVTFHPVTRQPGEAQRQTEALLAALDRFRQPVVITAPNADAEADVIRDMILAFVARRPRTFFVENFGALNYLAMLREAAAAVGNSSSGLIETPAFKLPTVNIGDRQLGRTRGMNVVDTPAEADAIARAIERVIDPAFRASIAAMDNPYGDGHAAERIVEVLRNVPIDARLVAKPFYDGPVELNGGAHGATSEPPR